MNQSLAIRSAPTYIQSMHLDAREPSSHRSRSAREESELLVNDPHSIFEDYRRTGASVWNEDQEAWFVCRFQDVKQLLTDRRLTPSDYESNVVSRSRDEDELDRFISHWPVFDPSPERLIVRRAVSNVMPSKVPDHISAEVRDSASQLRDRLGDSTFDLVWDYSRPASYATLGTLLSMGTTRVHELSVLSDQVLAYLLDLDSSPEVIGTALRAKTRMSSIAREYIEEGQAPVAGALRRVRNDVSEDRLIGMFAQLVTGSIEPLTNALVTAALYAVPHAKPPLSSDEYVTRSLLWDAPFYYAPRIARQPVKSAGLRIEAGERVRLALGSAARQAHEESQFSEWPLVFGRGTHFCLGMPLALEHLRIHTRMLLDELAVSDRLDPHSVRRANRDGGPSFTAAIVKPRRREDSASR